MSTPAAAVGDSPLQFGLNLGGSAVASTNAAAKSATKVSHESHIDYFIRVLKYGTHQEIMSALLRHEHETDLNEPDLCDKTWKSWATDVVTPLEDAQLQRSAVNPYRLPIHIALARGDLELVSSLQVMGAHIFTRTSRPLTFAAVSGSLAMVKQVLQQFLFVATEMASKKHDDMSASRSYHSSAATFFHDGVLDIIQAMYVACQCGFDDIASYIAQEPWYVAAVARTLYSSDWAAGPYRALELCIPSKLPESVIKTTLASLAYMEEVRAAAVAQKSDHEMNGGPEGCIDETTVSYKCLMCRGNQNASSAVSCSSFPSHSSTTTTTTTTTTSTTPPSSTSSPSISPSSPLSPSSWNFHTLVNPDLKHKPDIDCIYCYYMNLFYTDVLKAGSNGELDGDLGIYSLLHLWLCNALAGSHPSAADVWFDMFSASKRARRHRASEVEDEDKGKDARGRKDKSGNQGIKRGEFIAAVHSLRVDIVEDYLAQHRDEICNMFAETQHTLHDILAFSDLVKLARYRVSTPGSVPSPSASSSASTSASTSSSSSSSSPFPSADTSPPSLLSLNRDALYEGYHGLSPDICLSRLHAELGDVSPGLQRAVSTASAPLASASAPLPAHQQLQQQQQQLQQSVGSTQASGALTLEALLLHPLTLPPLCTEVIGGSTAPLAPKVIPTASTAPAVSSTTEPALTSPALTSPAAPVSPTSTPPLSLDDKKADALIDDKDVDALIVGMSKALIAATVSRLPDHKVTLSSLGLSSVAGIFNTFPKAPALWMHLLDELQYEEMVITRRERLHHLLNVLHCIKDETFVSKIGTTLDKMWQVAERMVKSLKSASSSNASSSSSSSSSWVISGHRDLALEGYDSGDQDDEGHDDDDDDGIGADYLEEEETWAVIADNGNLDYMDRIRRQHRNQHAEQMRGYINALHGPAIAFLLKHALISPSYDDMLSHLRNMASDELLTLYENYAVGNYINSDSSAHSSSTSSAPSLSSSPSSSLSSSPSSSFSPSQLLEEFLIETATAAGKFFVSCIRNGDIATARRIYMRYDSPTHAPRLCQPGGEEESPNTTTQHTPLIVRKHREQEEIDEDENVEKGRQKEKEEEEKKGLVLSQKALAIIRGAFMTAAMHKVTAANCMIPIISWRDPHDRFRSEALKIMLDELLMSKGTCSSFWVAVRISQVMHLNGTLTDASALADAISLIKFMSARGGLSGVMAFEPPASWYLARINIRQVLPAEDVNVGREMAFAFHILCAAGIRFGMMNAGCLALARVASWGRVSPLRRCAELGADLRPVNGLLNSLLNHLYSSSSSSSLSSSSSSFFSASTSAMPSSGASSSMSSPPYSSYSSPAGRSASSESKYSLLHAALGAYSSRHVQAMYSTTRGTARLQSPLASMSALASSSSTAANHPSILDLRFSTAHVGVVKMLLEEYGHDPIEVVEPHGMNAVMLAASYANKDEGVPMAMLVMLEHIWERML